MAGRNSNVDERIVRMTFDNKQFEKNVSTSMSTIDKLKKALKLEDAAKGFDEIDKAAKNVDFSHLVNGIQEVHNNFTFLDSITKKIFDSIADSALNLGKKIVNALAIEPVTTGFQEYETKMNSIQVIAANTGALNQDAAESAKSMADELGAAIDIWTKGSYGNGQARIDALTAAGLDPAFVQEQVNKLASGVEVTMDDLADDVEGSSGTTIGHIEDVLNELNLYADKTIYNFTQMTQAIGQFTTAGVDVDTSATAVKGIANLAAYVGAPASDASRSMFQLSQALATGRVRLQDWMSLEHTAGMGGKTFQNELIKTAEHLREVNEEYAMSVPSAQEAIEAEGSFRESLKDNWLTTDVLNETLAKFSGSFGETYWKELGYSDEDVAEIMNLGQVATDAATKVRTFTQMWDALKEAAQSGWTETWQYIVGGFEDAPVFWTAVNNAITSIIDPINQARNAALKFWSEEGGRSAWFSATTETVEVVDELGRKVAKLDENGKALVDSEGNIVYETERVTKYSGILSNVWETLKEVIEPIKKALRDVFPDDFGKILVNFSKKLEEITKNIRNAKKPTDKIYKTFKGLFTLFRLGLKIIGSVAKVFGHIAEKVLPLLTGGLLTVTSSISDVSSGASKMEKAFDFIDTVVDKITGGIDWLVSGIKNVANNIITFIKNSTGIDFGEAFSIEDFLTKAKEAFWFVLNWLEETTGIDIDGLFTTIVEKVKEIWAVLRDTASLSFQDINEFFTNLKDTMSIGDSISEKIGGMWDSVQGFFSYLSEEAGGVLDETVNPAMDGISDFFSGLDLKDLGQGAMIGLAIASLIELIKLVKKVSNFAEMVDEVKEAIVGVFEGVTDSLETFQKSVKINMLFKIALSIGILVGSIVALALLPEDQIKSALTMVIVLFGSLIAMLKSFDALLANGNFGAVGGLGFTFLGIGVALGMMTAALFALTLIPEDKLGKSIAALGFMFGYIGAMLKTIRGFQFNGMIGMAVAILAISAAIDIMVPAVMVMGNMNSDALGQGMLALLGLFSMMLLLVVLLEEMQKTAPAGSAATIAVPVLAIAAAVDILVAAVFLLGSMNSDKLEQGMFAVFRLVGIMTIALVILTNTAQAMSLGSVLAMTVMVTTIVGAVYMIIGAIWLLGSMDTKKLEQGLDAFLKISGVLMAIIGIIGLIAIILTFVKKLSFGGGGGMLSSLSTNLIVVAASIFLVAAALWLMVDAMTKFWALLEKIGNNGSTVLKKLAEQLAESIPYLGEILLTHIPMIVEILLKGLVLIFTAINNQLPQLYNQISTIIFDLLGFLGTLIIESSGMILQILIDLIIQLRTKLDALIEQLVLLLIDLISGLGNALTEHSDEFVVALLELLIGIGTLVGEVFKAIWTMWQDSDAYKALEEFGGKVYTFVENIATSVDRGIKAVKGWFTKTFVKIKIFFRKNINHIKYVIEQTWDSFVEAGRNIVEAIKEGIIWAWENSLAGKIVEFAQNLIAKFTGKDGIDAHSPSRKFIEIGKYIPQGLAKGISDFSGIAEDSVGDLSDSVISSFGNPMSTIAELVDSGLEFDPVISPVMDMSNVYSGMGVINGMFGRRSLGIATINSTLNAEALKLRDSRNQNSIYSDTNVIASINGLREDVNNLNGAMSGMRVVLDSGTLVGATVGPMDAALGRRAQRTKRGG